MPRTESTEPEYSGASFESLTDGPTKIILAAMFHGDPSLIESAKTESQWRKAIDSWLAETA